MKRTIRHIKDKIIKALEGNKNLKESSEKPKPYEPREYLIPLLENIKSLKEKNEIVAYKVISKHDKGFKVKVKGLFGFVTFKNFPFKNYSHTEWEIIFPYIQDKYFTAKIEKVKEKEKNIHIYLFGCNHHFEPNPLIIGNTYTGIILSIDYKKEGIWLEFGHKYDWKYGSLKGFLPSKLTGYYNLLPSLIEGQDYETKYWGLNYKQEFVLSNILIDTKWFETNLNLLLGQKLDIEVIRSEKGEKAFRVLERYEAIVPIRISIYGKKLLQAKLTIESLKPGDKIKGLVTRVNPIAGHIVLRIKQFDKYLQY